MQSDTEAKPVRKFILINSVFDPETLQGIFIGNTILQWYTPHLWMAW